MALEIERRFLIKNDNWKEFINKKVYIEQGYFSKSLDNWIIRVRLIGKNSKITLKKHIEIEKKSWIIDCFKENNYPLEIAEIELSNEEEDLFLPSFISKEITGLTHYSNFSLANNPFSQWKED